MRVVGRECREWLFLGAIQVDYYTLFQRLLSLFGLHINSTCKGPQLLSLQTLIALDHFARGLTHFKCDRCVITWHRSKRAWISAQGGVLRMRACLLWFSIGWRLSWSWGTWSSQACLNGAKPFQRYVFLCIKTTKAKSVCINYTSVARVVLAGDSTNIISPAGRRLVNKHPFLATFSSLIAKRGWGDRSCVGVTVKMSGYQGKKNIPRITVSIIQL